MTAFAQALSRTTGTEFSVESLSGNFIFGGISLLVLLVGLGSYGLDLSPGFF